MKFSEIVEQAHILLQRTGKITYRALKREFALDDEALADLKDELLFSDPQVREEDGRGLVWVGQGSLASSVQNLESEKHRPTLTDQTLDPRLSDPRRRPPVSYTPAH